MFTGIISDVGQVRAIVAGGEPTYRIATRRGTEDLAIGASVACSGVCLTVIDKASDWFAVQVSAETCARTTLGDWQVGSRVNLERALRAGDELGGHLLTGHVDTVAAVRDQRQEGDSRRLVIEVPEPFEQGIAAKGSVALDGVSLTVNEIAGRRFGVNLIPHTLAHTTFDTIAVGDRVNLEIDILARYVARLLRKSLA